MVHTEEVHAHVLDKDPALLVVHQFYACCVLPELLGKCFIVSADRSMTQTDIDDGSCMVVLWSG